MSPALDLRLQVTSLVTLMSRGLSSAKVKGIMRVEITAIKENCILTVFDHGNGRIGGPDFGFSAGTVSSG